MTDQVAMVVGLLVLGWMLLALEIFVVPGFGAPGILGLGCLVAACWLAFHYFGRTMGGAMVIGVLALSTVAAILLPRTPFGRWMVHRKTLATAQASRATVEVHEEGLAETVLRPAGIAFFGDRRESVVAAGDFIEAGTRVVVVEVEGSRIVVERADTTQDD
jgi:membrane-bound serine protease (ClpP class)